MPTNTRTVLPPFQDPPPYEGTLPNDRRIKVILTAILAQMHHDLLGKYNRMRQMIQQVINEKEDEKRYLLGMERLENFHKELKDDLNGWEKFSSMWRDDGTSDRVSILGARIKDYYELVDQTHKLLNRSYRLLKDRKGDARDIRNLSNAWKSSQIWRPTIKETITDFERSLREDRSEGDYTSDIQGSFYRLEQTMYEPRQRIKFIESWVKDKMEREQNSQETTSRSGGGRTQIPTPSSRRSRR